MLVEPVESKLNCSCVCERLQCHYAGCLFFVASVGHDRGAVSINTITDVDVDFVVILLNSIEQFAIAFVGLAVLFEYPVDIASNSRCAHVLCACCQSS